MYTDDESDGASVISQVESVFSIASLHSAATGLSVASGFSAAQIETATKELLHIFLDDQVLASLYTVAVERVDIGPVRLQRNIGRLLKAFARDLRNEAEQELEKLAARLVSAKRYYVAQAIIDRYEIRAPSELTSHPQSPLRSQQREDSSDEEEEEVDEGRMEEPVDEDLIEDLLAFRQFLAAGEAFERFRRQLEAFVLPKLTEVKNETTVGEPSTNMESAPNPGSRLPEQAKQKVQPTVLSKIQKATAHLVSAAGLLEPPLDCGWVRLRWQCRCGQQFFGDVKEFRANGVKELIEKMSRSTGAKVTVVPYDSTSTNQNWALKAPSWVRKLTSTSKFGQAKGSSSTEYLPQHNVPAQCPQSTLSTPTSNDTVPSKPKIHLLSCTHRTQRRKCLLQDPIDSVFTDRALFCFMQQQLQRNRSRIRSLLSMRSIQGMFFVKFRLRMGNMVEVRDHNPCCTSTNPNTCECIPPVPKVEPSPTAEYRCTPAGPLATWPPVLSQDLMHMLSSPECINEQETWVLDQLPKRTVGELQASAGQPAEGWGVYYQEGVDFDMVIAVVFVVFLLASLLFAVLWTKFEMDVQGAFGVSSYMITAAGIFLAMVASRAKNFGS
ncbi:hypothetical protein BU25DRAFT_354992 [Macroventuria anomochaeta]|uniref:Uncharacterized protein n=1 Tax=Macroventuria anomochaeta TaxID=301207 RepID=A0ACB6RJ77_9PLEO|nr:uncharacterized protein BU25DRAFT_354992 [Macroventuria anomochaeta]KAF2621158.1 hypothetical protein BU25DRAFT_354992 [Macroventuria anomochaeta]